MNDALTRKAAKEFAEYWKDKGYEKGESQKFWLSLLRDICGVEEPEKFISFEDQVHLDNTSFIDGMIPATHVMIEQKGSKKDLMKPIKQSDGTLLTPFQQAKRYSAELPYSQRPRWIVTCNFQEFHVYDMEQPGGTPEVILLENLPKEYYRLSFLTHVGNEHLKREMEVSIAAGEIVGLLYDAFLKQYKDPENEQTLRSLNVLCVRLVFCLYAEDAGIFGKKEMFHDYLAEFDTRHMRKALIELFQVLDTPVEERDPYLEPELAAFPYVNGGLFAEEYIEIPMFTDEIRELILKKASDDFDWSEISPTIFGAVFESTLNPETRRSGGMHYTSIENIHKVIDPLFLDDLKKQLEELKAVPVTRTREKKLREFQDHLASLSFLDSAAGSGNFLTETYLSIRRIENEIIRELQGGQMVMGAATNPIKVSISQFYGIEINDFAVTVAKTALWIAESQMMKETESIVLMNLDFLPLKTNANIVEGNALRMDWNDVIPNDRLSFLMGNPPFGGHQWRSKEQVRDMEIAFHDLKKHGKLDYVASWYQKAADYMQGTKIRAAFVSTNSITQGESVGILWGFLFEKKHVEIQFAYRTFVWVSEAKNQAAVHCVIIGFTCYSSKEEKILYDGDRYKKVAHINGYLIDAPDIFVQSRGKQLTSGVPAMTKGSQPTDGGFLILSEEEKEKLIREYPDAEKMIRQFVGSYELINNKRRYCLWLKGIAPADYRKITPIMMRLEQVSEFRKTSATESVRKDAEIPMLFTQIRQPDSDYLAMPKVSSERRRYIPIDYLDKEVIGSDLIYTIPDATLYLFGVLNSNVHMAWTRVVCGRLKSDYRYGPAVYNNFPWPHPTAEQRKKIEDTARAILDARKIYSDNSLADLYDEVAMPPELRRAHQNNDRAVMQAYGFPIKGFTEADCVAELMKLYQTLTEKS
ncbi:MAG: class I SAM-dependent DNA methyltransferase [Oscillospiraceae bacterium]|nr:class I SAM-dependent DNA methyltransferase [Oscillospiraceae bacterium]